MKIIEEFLEEDALPEASLGKCPKWSLFNYQTTRRKTPYQRRIYNILETRFRGNGEEASTLDPQSRRKRVRPP
jgi:hypothetical protein